MYYVNIVHGDKQVSISYHNCQTLKVDDKDSRVLNNIVSIQADDSELTRILDLFKDTIPYPQGHRVVSWYGDIAKCIHSAMVCGDMFGYR